MYRAASLNKHEAKRLDTKSRDALDTLQKEFPFRRTNKQASFGGSILKANMEMEAEAELAHDLDASGMHCVWLNRVGLLDFC